MNSRLVLPMLIALCTLIFCGTASAQQRVTKKVVKDSKVTFDDEEIQGSLRAPVNAFIISRDKAKLPPLIKFREHFKKELSESADTL